MSISPTSGISKDAFSGISLNGSSGSISYLTPSSSLIAKYPLISNLLDTVNGYSATFTRSTTKHFSNDSGVYSTVAIDAPAYTGSGILLEPESTNPATYSYDISNAAYTKTRLTATTATVTGPDGATSAGELEVTATSGSGAFFSINVTTLVNSQQTIKFIVKYDSCPFLFVQGYNFAQTNGVSQFFNISNNTLGTYSSQAGGWTIESATIEAKSDGYSEIALVVNTLDTEFSAIVYLCSADADSTCTAGQKVKYYNFSVQENNTSPIRTTTTALTRTIDALGVPTTDFPTSEFSYYFKYTPTATPDSFSQYVLFNSDNSTYWVNIYFSAIDTWHLAVTSGAESVIIDVTKTIVKDATYQILCRVSAGGTYLEISDGTSASNTGIGISSITNHPALYLGSNNNTINSTISIISDFKVIPNVTTTLAQAAAL